MLQAHSMLIGWGGRIEDMNGMISSVIVGFLLGASSFWLIGFLNDTYTHREKNLSRLLLKRGKKD